MVTADPTIDSLELLKDPSKVHKVPNVPIFIPHVRKDPETGEVLYKVTEERLRDIAAVCNSRAAEGVHGKLQIGHTKKGAPQKDQPPLVGLYHNYRPAMFGPKQKPGLLADFYYFKKDFEEAKKYPFRSAEFYPNTNEITAVALLMSDPELDMGMLLHERAKGPCYFYSSKELPMDFASQVIPDEPIDEKELAKFVLYMRKAFPRLYEQFGPGGGGQDGGDLGAMGYQRQDGKLLLTLPVATPPGATPPTVSPLAKENAELYQRNEQLSARLAKIEGDYNADRLAVQYERKLLELDPERSLDHTIELADLRTMNETQATAHLKRIERMVQLSRTPIGQPMLRIEDSVQHTRDNAPTTEYESQQALEFVTAMQDEGKEIGFAEALREVKKRTRKTA